jgi:D-sedoheptulose 7-phosphate isomerase
MDNLDKDSSYRFSKALCLRRSILEEIGTAFDEKILQASEFISESVLNGGTLFFAGNGGSAAEAQHMSAEYLATLNHRNFRPGIRSMALTTDTSFLTAWTNDFDYEAIFARQLETMGRTGDVFLAFSTSGNSRNICQGIKSARASGLKIIGFSGGDGGAMMGACDLCFNVPAASTAHIQEVHTMIGHELCALVEKKVFFK